MVSDLPSVLCSPPFRPWPFAFRFSPASPPDSLQAAPLPGCPPNRVTPKFGAKDRTRVGGVYSGYGEYRLEPAGFVGPLVTMLTTRTNRLDPSLIPEDELADLVKVFAKPDHVALIDEHGNRTHIPEALFQHFARIVRMMSERKAIVMLPEDEAFTTQAAANYLGMSRQFLVNLLEKGEIPHHRVGTHRRVIFKDLLKYEKKRDKTRREAMDRLTDEVHKAGLYFPDYQGDE